MTNSARYPISLGGAHAPALWDALPELHAGMLARVAARALWLLLLRAPRTLILWRRRSLERTHLAELDDRLLRDIGLTRQQVRQECAKWFWQP